MSRIFGDGTSPMSNFAYIVNEMREVVKNKISAGREMSADERAVEKFCKDMISDWANCLARQYIEIGNAVLDFFNAFTLVYPPNDKDFDELVADEKGNLIINPLAAAAWPFVAAWFMWHETDEDGEDGE